MFCTQLFKDQGAIFSIKWRLLPLSSIFNERGVAVNLLMVMVLVIVTISSMVVLINLIQDDGNQVLWLQDRIQQELLLRSETIRINYMLERQLPKLIERRVEIVSSDRVATHIINHSERPLPASGYDGGNPPKKIGTMCVTLNGRRMLGSQLSTPSPVKSYVEKYARRSSLAQYLYFTDREMSDISNVPGSNAAAVRFDGRDSLNGEVHSNDFIVIMNGGSPPAPDSYSGWPVFHKLVTTAKEIRVWTGTNLRPLSPSDPVDRIFLGGLKENAAPIDYQADASTIKEKGTHWTEGADIYYVEITPEKLKVMTATIETKIDTVVVYTSYPDSVNPNTVVGDSLWTNYIAWPETTWVHSNEISYADQSFYFPGVLWVKGTVSGKLTLASKYDTYILGHILYNRTPAGARPDPSNPTDYFGLVSEGKIIIKYKYKDPETGALIYSPNAVNSSSNVYIYGALSAQGIADPSLGEYAYKAEGTFTYEYQHPHGSPQPYMGYRRTLNTRYPVCSDGNRYLDYTAQVQPNGNTIYTRKQVLIDKIDMHRFKFPPDNNVGLYWRNWPGNSTNSGQNGFPTVNVPANQHFYGIYDYPFYNPNYPERQGGENPPANTQDINIVYQRGTLNVYGAIAQRRRGFMNRSGTIRDDNPDTNIYWDMGDYVPAGPRYFTGGNYVFGGAHYSTGYTKKYFYDTRFYYVQPPHYPEIYRGYGKNLSEKYEETTWSFMAPPKDWIYID